MVIVHGDSEAGGARADDGCETRATHLHWRKMIVLPVFTMSRKNVCDDDDDHNEYDKDDSENIENVK